MPPEFQSWHRRSRATMWGRPSSWSRSRGRFRPPHWLSLSSRAAGPTWHRRPRTCGTSPSREVEPAGDARKARLRSHSLGRVDRVIESGHDAESDRKPDIKPRSRDVTDGLEKAAARGMLRAVGMGDDDWVKPQIGVASSWNE